MKNLNDMNRQTKDNFGWILLFGISFLQTLSAGFLLVFSSEGTFEADTGVSWAELTRIYPTVATQFTMAQQASLVATVAVGLFSLLVTYFPFREGQRWAWFAMWILPVSILPGIISLAQTENQAGIALFGGAFILVAITGLVISYRVIKS